MISHELKFIFIHIEKTAGSSLTLKLKDYSDDNIIMGLEDEINISDINLIKQGYTTKRFQPFNIAKHLTIHDYRKYYDADMVNRYFKFSIVRDPYERFRSMFHFQVKKKFGGSYEKKDTKIITERVFSILIPQTDYIDETVTIVKYENLIADLNALTIFKEKGITFNDLPFLNKAKEKNIILDEETKNKIRHIYYKDFLFFDYKM